VVLEDVDGKVMGMVQLEGMLEPAGSAKEKSGL
jgi:hypothetical protein